MRVRRGGYEQAFRFIDDTFIILCKELFNPSETNRYFIDDTLLALCKESWNYLIHLKRAVTNAQSQMAYRHLTDELERKRVE